MKSNNRTATTTKISAKRPRFLLANSTSAVAVKPVRIVGIGASAGGLEAFTELLRHLPTHAGVAYVLVQHLDPTHRSLLSELLARVTTLPVREIVHNSPVEPNQIYVIPPNTNLSLEKGILKLSPRKKNAGPARSIDHFLKSLAEDQKENAIAVILSGAGSDGAQGLKAVKAEGGLTFAQDEGSAKYNSMPRSAAATGCVDFVLSPEKIAEEIARIISHPASTKNRAAANAKRRRVNANGESGVARWGRRLSNGIAWPVPPADINLRKIFLLLRTKTGTDFTFYKMNTIRRRLARRMAANKVKGLESYAKLLREHPAEIETLYQDLLIHVSSFFRNPASYEILKRKVFPKLVKAHSGSDAMRFWVAGCSTGQEAYSLAMAYTEFCEQSPVQVPIQIFATDVNGAVLDRARAGRYVKAEIENVSAVRLKKFFLQENGHYRVQKPIRDMVVFAQHNLLTDPPFTRVDLVTCRNVLIYFDATLQEKIIPTFHYAMKPDGFLWLGASESIGQFGNLFAPVDKANRIYSKKPTATWLRLERPPLLPPNRIATTPIPLATRTQEFNAHDAQKEADRVTLAKYTPVSVLVNEDLEVLQFRGDTSQYLGLPSGKATFSLTKMARDGLAMPLQKLVQRAKKENRIVREKGVRFSGRGRVVNLEAVPLKNLKAQCFIIFFEKPPRAAKRDAFADAIPYANNAKSKLDLKQAAELKQELDEMREQLHSIQEEHETAVEELQASNEEVQSSNEELQSLNEELETSNEELESANEELTTLNEELATRNTELRESEQRLREQAQLLDMAPILARSPKDRVIFWSGGAEQMYGFTNEEAVGQTSHMLLNAHFFEPLEKIQAKLLREGHWEGEVQHRRKDGRIIHVATKWVVHKDAQNKLRAVLEVNTDITARKEAEKALRASEEFNRSILENSPDSIKVLGSDARLIFMNAAGQQIMEINDFKTCANAYWPSLWEGENRTQAEQAIRRALAGETARFQGLRPTVTGTPKWWDVAVRPIFGPDKKPEKLLAVARDITEQKRAESEIRQTARLAALRAEISVAVATAHDLRPTLQHISECLVRHLDAAFARVWTLNEKENVLELQASAGIYTHINGAHARVKVGDFKIGRIAAQRRAHWNNDVQHDSEISDPDWAQREGMVAFAGYPLIVDDVLMGVAAVFACQPLPESALNELSFAADSIAQFVQRRRAEEARQWAQEKLNRYTEDLENHVTERTASLRQTIGELEAFSYSVSHDLRTPLRAMDGYARALLEDCGDKLDSQHRKYLERIIRGAKRLDQLTLDVLAYSRLSRADFTPQPVDLNKLVLDTIEQYPHLEAAKEQITVQEPLLPVCGHPAFLAQCVSNLLGNAVKFVAPDNKPAIKIWTEPSGANVRLLIRDNGIGIAPEHRDRVFQIFGRVHNDKTYEGTGIGLAVVQRAVQRMGGTIDFLSQPGEGSTFWIELPSTSLPDAKGEHV